MGFIEDQNLNTVKYDLNYFIEKFIAIPEEEWGAGEFVARDGTKCALGHCGVRPDETDDGKLLGLLVKTEESNALIALVPNITQVNDNTFDYYDPYGDTPKDRVINYLTAQRDLKALRDGKA